jgi:Carboxypeptidase regulatory-like domain
MLGALVVLCLSVGSSDQSSAVVPLVGTVRDANGGVLPGAAVALLDPASKVAASAVTTNDGTFTLRVGRAGDYRLRVTLSGFESREQPVHITVDHVVPIEVVLAVSRLEVHVTVQGTARDVALESVPRGRIDRQVIDTLPSESVSSGLSSLLTLTTPGVAADSNGVFHPLGEHAETSFSIDNQPVSDQQSRIFSNQLSLNAIQSVDVLTGVPPAEFGDKTSLIAVATTRSGLGMHRATGSASVGFASFRTPTADFTLGSGTASIGNFIAVDGTFSRRFLDTPEVEALHADGHFFNLFDRFDAQFSSQTSMQLNVSAAQSSFQTPNTYDQEAAGQDQGQHQHTINVAPSFKRVLSEHSVLEVNGWARFDRLEYHPTANPFADQPATLAQRRSLTNTGGKATVTATLGSHTLKAGLQETTTWLREHFETGLTDPTFNTPCSDAAGNPTPDTSLSAPTACANRGLTVNDGFLPALLPFDLTRGGTLFRFDGTGRITQYAAYAQDALQLGAWNLMVGTRFDIYDGLSRAAGIQPRAGVTYRLDRTNTVWRAAYGRIFLTPYNENLVLASSTGAGGFGNGLLGSVGGDPLIPARRNQYDLGIEQRLWRRIRVDGDYFWKFTDGPYDFNVILNTPLTFPVQFRKSVIDGGLVRITLPEVRGVQVYATFSHTRSRLFGPSVGGLRFSGNYAPVARPDHDEPLQMTTHLEYRTSRISGLWTGLTWRYDSGLVAVSVPTYGDALQLTGDEQAAMGLYCGSTFAMASQPIRNCAAPALGATRIRIPPPGTENDDTNPPRIAPHHVFDVGAGFDALKVGGIPLRARISVVNVFNTVALYNFLSTFAGTHFVTPRAYQFQLAVTF